MQNILKTTWRCRAVFPIRLLGYLNAGTLFSRSGIKGYTLCFAVKENKSNLSHCSFKHHVIMAYRGVGTLVPCSVVVSGQVLVLTALLARK